MSDHLPDVYQEFRDRFPDVMNAVGSLASAVDATGDLDERTVRLVKLGVAIGAQAEGAVRSNVRKALAAGATSADIEHVVVLALTTRGFPAVVAAWGWVREVLEASDD